VWLARHLRELGRLEEARVSLDVALKMFRVHPIQHGNRFAAETELALLAEASGDPSAAVTFFESVLASPLRSSDRDVAERHLDRLREAVSR